MLSLKWILVAGETVFNFWTTRAMLRHQQVIDFTTITKHHGTMSSIAIHTHIGVGSRGARGAVAPLDFW